jgi:pyrimidine-nucleoside phosphorylase
MTVIDPRPLIAAKRDGRLLSAVEIKTFVDGYTTGEFADAPAAAFLMACLLNGLDEAETLALTKAMVESGDTLRFGSGKPLVDKHSTGGVADGVTLIFAPLAAALGLSVAKLSGRGLGHTGGTLDKLESIPGLRTDLPMDALAKQVEDFGCAVAAQSDSLVPADRALYALRDATATVPSIQLIAASVMSKKLAVTTDLILLDVKVGSGAFMKSSEQAVQLAQACLSLAAGWGRAAMAAVTDMSQPLGEAIGNAIDIAETVEVLSGRRRGRLRELAVTFAARGLESLEGVSHLEAVAKAEAALDDGSALERFARMIEAQGGDPRVTQDPWAVLPRAPVIRPLISDRAGFLTAVMAEDLGMAAVAMGAGRIRKSDPIDPAVGIVIRAKIGDPMQIGLPIGEIHARTDASAAEAELSVLRTLTVGPEPVEAPPLVYTWLGVAP